MESDPESELKSIYVIICLLKQMFLDEGGNLIFFFITFKDSFVNN